MRSNSLEFISGIGLRLCNKTRKTGEQNTNIYLVKCQALSFVKVIIVTLTGRVDPNAGHREAETG